MLKEGQYVKVNNREEQCKVMEMLEGKKFSTTERSQTRLTMRSEKFPKFFDMPEHEYFHVWNEEGDCVPSKEVLYKDLIKPKYEIGKEYLFSDLNGLNRIDKLFAIVDGKFPYLVHDGGGEYYGFSCIEEIEDEDPKIKELEEAIEKFQKKLEQIKNK